MGKTIERICKTVGIGVAVISLAGGIYLADKLKDKVIDYIPKIEKQIVSYYISKR